MARMGGISLLFDDEEQKIMAANEPAEAKKPKDVVGGLSLLFKDYQPELKKKNSNTSTIKDDHQEQKQEDVNRSSSSGIMAEVEEPVVDTEEEEKKTNIKSDNDYRFKMPLHFPRFSKKQYEEMGERDLDNLLQQYGLCINHEELDSKKQFAVGAFLWPSAPSPSDQASQEKDKSITSSTIVGYLCRALGFP